MSATVEGMPLKEEQWQRFVAMVDWEVPIGVERVDGAVIMSVNCLWYACRAEWHAVC